MMDRSNNEFPALTEFERVETANGIVEITKQSWGKEYKGSKPALIELGIANDGWFPGDEGNNKVSLRIFFYEDNSYQIVNDPAIQRIPGMMSIRRNSSQSKQFIIWERYTAIQADDNPYAKAFDDKAYMKFRKSLLKW